MGRYALGIVQLFHGSNVPVTRPALLSRQRTLDFGPGFYLTSNLEQARRWRRCAVWRWKRELGRNTRFL
ncbi:MAG: DUF3990 domain-containing protein [Propionibacteriaceae bacterium]|nr:DUF3990 domain-containing protein [Propionibacteriaceae bacterium]